MTPGAGRPTLDESIRWLLELHATYDVVERAHLAEGAEHLRRALVQRGVQPDANAMRAVVAIILELREYLPDELEPVAPVVARVNATAGAACVLYDQAMRSAHGQARGRGQGRVR